MHIAPPYRVVLLPNTAVIVDKSWRGVGKDLVIAMLDLPEAETAEFIVKACNTYEDLVILCEELMDAVGCDPRFYEIDEEDTEVNEISAKLVDLLESL